MSSGTEGSPRCCSEWLLVTWEEVRKIHRGQTLWGLRGSRGRSVFIHIAMVGGTVESLSRIET